MGDEILPAGSPHTGNRLPVISTMDNRQASNDIGGMQSLSGPILLRIQKYRPSHKNSRRQERTYFYTQPSLRAPYHNIKELPEMASALFRLPSTASTSRNLPDSTLYIPFLRHSLPSHLIPTDFLFIRQPYSRAGILPFFIHRIPLP